jgi:UPF0755 protein
MKLFLKLFGGTLLTAAIAATICALLIYQQLNTAVTPQIPVLLTIAPGASLSRVANQLEEQGVITSALTLRLLARLDTQLAQIQAGRYNFSEAATPPEILARLHTGDTIKLRLTIPEGFTLKQIIERIAAEGYGNKQRLYQLASDPDFLKKLQVAGESLEGYLFPETYLFTEGATEEALLKMMVDLCHQQLDPALLADASTQGLTPHQLVTLASIIEKETGAVDEMPLISSVFHNRLSRGIPLQTDPTVIYGIKDFDGNLTRKDLKTPSPYNTYLMRGLPPGPIASPGRTALEAAAHPAQSKYLYFVARGDGSHQFSKTLEEHNAAVRKYQLRR